MVFENLLVALAGLALLLYLGAGLSAWLPPALAPYRWLVAPWAGYSFLVIVTQFLTNSPFSLTALQSCYAALALATPVNLYALRLWIRSRGDTPQVENRREMLWVALLALGLFVLGVLPLWSYGYTTVIGENWDAEIYMSLGEYLKVYAQSGLLAATPNPVLDTLINPPYSLRTHGFSYLQAGLGFLPLDSLQTLAPLLALVRALSIPAAYIFFRVTLRLGWRTALLASAALALNAFLLWVTYNTFGMQVPTFGLLPLAVCLAALAFSHDGSPFSLRSPSIWAGLVLAAIAVTYHPALTAWAALAGPVFLVALVVAWRSGRRAAWALLRSGLVMAAVGVVLSAVSQVKSFEGFLKQYSEKTGGLGLTGFTSPTDAFGFSLSFRDLLPSDPGRPLLTALTILYGGWGWLALAAVLVLVAYYLYRLARSGGQRRTEAWLQGALLAGAIAYVLLFLRPLNYPYGWFKALSFVSFVPVGMAAGGLAYLVAPSNRRRLVLASLLGVLVAVPLLATTWLTVGMYWGNPIRFDRQMLAVGSARPLVAQSPGDGSVYVSNSPNMQRLGRLFNGLLSYFLRDTDLYGKYQTANSKLDHLRPDGLYGYYLLNSEDSPSEYGVAGAKLLWQNPLMSLYASPPAGQRLDLYHHNFRDDGKYPTVKAGAAPLSFSVVSDTLQLGDLPATGPYATSDPQQISFGLASPVTTTLAVEWFDTPDTMLQERVTIPPGYTLYRSKGSVRSPGRVRLSVESGPPGAEVYVRWAHLEKYMGESGQETGISSDGSGLITTVSSSSNGDNINLDVGYLNNKPESPGQTLSLDIYGADKSHFGYWNFPVQAGSASDLRVTLDAARKALVSSALNGLQVSPERKLEGRTDDGRYVASLLVYEHGQVVEAFNDIFTFTLEDGKVTDFRSRPLPPLFR